MRRGGCNQLLHHQMPLNPTLFECCGTDCWKCFFDFNTGTQHKYLYIIIIMCSFTTTRLNGLKCTLTIGWMVLGVIGMPVCALTQSVLTQSPVPNQCESNGHLRVQSVYKLVWQEWL